MTARPIYEAVPLNEVTTPIEGQPDYRRTAEIKVVFGEKKIPVARISYEHFGNEEYQYIIEPYWEMIDKLESENVKIFWGIPGINMDCRYRKYCRVNHVPAFIVQRTPPRNREDVMELMEEVGLNYYDAFEWLIRTKYKASQDNLIVEKITVAS